MRMNWFRGEKMKSEKNGTLVIERSFFHPVVSVNGFFQTGPYMDVLWKKALRLIPRKTPIKRALILGYGAGGTNRLIRQRFPHANITAIEWDPQMIEIAKKFKLHRPEDLTELRMGDAGSVIHELTGSFDLIIFDLYHGRHPSPLLEDPVFLQRLAELLGPRGYFLINAFGKPEAFNAVAKFLNVRLTWKFRWNHCALVRPFGSGGLGDPLLPGFLPYRAVTSYQKDQMSILPRQTFLSGPGYCGRRWSAWPFVFEMYFGDVEPVLEQGVGRRMVFWQPITRLDRPKGWHRYPFMPNFRKGGYAPVGSADKYWNAWEPHAQRHRKRWLAHPDAEIKKVDLETFLASYRFGTVDFLLKRMFVWMLRKREEAHAKDMTYWLAVNAEGKGIAGLAVLDLPEVKSSLHVIAFYQKAFRHSDANYGLIDHWFRHAIEKGFNYLDFDVFRGATDPKSWEGFTRFKGQFGTRFIVYPNPLVRFVR